MCSSQFGLFGFEKVVFLVCDELILKWINKHFLVSVLISNSMSVGSYIPNKQKLFRVLSNFWDCIGVLKMMKCLRITASEHYSQP